MSIETTAEAYPLPSAEGAFTVVFRGLTNEERRELVAHPKGVIFSYSNAIHDRDEARSYAERLAVDARRYQWLRDRLAIEDIERLERDYLGSHDESESVKCDREVDAALSKKEPL